MAELGDSPEIEYESDFDVRPSRRFARLVGSPAVRRISSRRLAWAILASAGVLAVLILGGTRGVQALTHWVAEQPENQINFSDIELQPEAPPYILSKSAGFLEKVREEARLPERLPILEADLEKLRIDFRRSPWVEDVAKVEVRRHRLIVSLVYSRPMAVVAVDGGPRVVIDKDGRILPGDDIDWVDKKVRPRVRGVADPLPVIFDVAGPVSRKPGTSFKSSASEKSQGEADPEVRKAARLAEYLSHCPNKTVAGRQCPDFEMIAPSHVEDGLLLLDTRKNWVYWGTAPGAELPQNPSADAKWQMLQDWIDREGGLHLEWDKFLYFTSAGPKIGKFPDKPVPGRSPKSPSR